MKFYFYTFLLSLLFLSCNNSSSVKGDLAYFGGEIINPCNSYITINHTLGNKDTIYLDKDNRFIHKINNLVPGLYSFTHGGEYQSIFLEPNDSLFFRLNTNDFDESLVYTGVGSKKNNYLIKSFLNDEIENKEFMNTSHMEPEVFMKHMKKLRKQKLTHLDHFLSNKPTSDLFKNIVTSSINYSHYAYHEMYPFGYYGNNKLIHFKDLPDEFYDYRIDVNLNDEKLSELYVYNRFLFWHFNNRALKQYYSHGHHETFDRMAFNYNIEKLRLIDSTISSKKIKNYLLKHITKDFILNTNIDDETNNMIAYYVEKTTNSEDKTYIKDLAKTAKKLRPSNTLPDTDLLDYKGNTIKLSSIVDSPTVIYCWSTNFKMHSRNSHYRIKELKTEFPKVNFIAVNFNDNDLHYWKKTLRLLKYPSKNEYMFTNSSKAIEDYLITFSHKVIVVDEHMEIISSNTGLFSEKMIKNLQKASSLSNSIK